MTKPTFKRSGGPKTPEGKLAISNNALKTGTYANALLLPGESQADFQELYESLLTELQAEGVLESTLVRELAVLTWKRLRIEQIEYNVLLAKLDAPVKPDELEDLGLSNTPELQNALQMVAMLTEEELIAKKAEADSILQLLNKEDRLTKIAEIKQSQPKLYIKLCDLLVDEKSTRKLANDLESMTWLNLVRAFTCNEEMDEMIAGFAEPLCAYFQRQVTDIEFALKQTELIEASRQKIRDLRIGKFMLAESPSRAKDDLSRNFYRTLKELRTQQAWRRQNQIIDVTPNNQN